MVKYQANQVEYVMAKNHIITEKQELGNKYNCTYCEKHYVTKKSLKLHVEFEHLGIKFSCDFCPYQANNQSRLNTHTSIVHE